MNIDVTFDKRLPQIVKEQNIYFSKGTKMNNVKGFYIKRNKSIVINLSAHQWNIAFLINSEDRVTDLFAQVLAHETIHHLIDEMNIKVTDKAEERICQLLVGEKNLKPAKNRKI